MLGAIAGDIIGSVYEHRPIKTKDFPLFEPRSTFTDDTVLTAAVADVLLHGGSYESRFREYYSRYPRAGYGGFFHTWARSSKPKPYGSFGNGSAMRVSPVGFAFDDLETVLAEAKRSAEVTHDHPEGIKGAQATAAAIFLARTKSSKPEIAAFVAENFGYRLDDALDTIRPGYQFDVTCQGTVPAALICFLQSTDFEDTIRNAVSLGGDSDTLACIAGSVAQAYYRVIPDYIEEECFRRLDPHLAGIAQGFTQIFVES
jgi:ADP-ribosylglycohydrolase